MMTISEPKSQRPNLIVEPEFLDKVLRPYRRDCRYLKSVCVDFDGADQGSLPSWETMNANGVFSIDQSCYIDDTGHFNAVEFNICYNQLAYVLLAVCVRDRLLPALSDFTLETFFEKQLSNFLIANINSSYHSQIHPRKFFGRVRILSARQRGKLSILKTLCAFTDEHEGRSDGEVKLAVLTP